MKTKVIFRKIYWHESEPEINAIFTEDKEGHNLYGGYAHIGQHTAIHSDFLHKSIVGLHKIENASENEYKALKTELESIGYELEILN